MSTNGQACYDKLDKSIVELSWLDDCTQSISLRDFLLFCFSFTWPGIQSHPFTAGPAEPLTPRPTITHHPPSPVAPMPHAPQPSTPIPIKGLVWSVDRWRGKCDFEEEEKKAHEVWGNWEWRWWNQAIMNQTRSLFHPIFQHISWSTAERKGILQSERDLQHGVHQVAQIWNSLSWYISLTAEKYEKRSILKEKIKLF